MLRISCTVLVLAGLATVLLQAWPLDGDAGCLARPLSADAPQGAADLLGHGGLLRGDGWLGGRPVDPREPSDRPRLVVLVDPSHPQAAVLARGARAAAGFADRCELIWCTTAASPEALASWLTEQGVEGAALWGLDHDVARGLGGTLPMVRLFDAKGRVVARDLIGAAATLRGRPKGQP
jgi:hypothetical protein